MTKKQALIAQAREALAQHSTMIDKAFSGSFWSPADNLRSTLNRKSSTMASIQYDYDRFMEYVQGLIDLAYAEALEAHQLFCIAADMQAKAIERYEELPADVCAYRVNVHGFVQGVEFEFNIRVWSPSEGLSVCDALEGVFGKPYLNSCSMVTKLEQRLQNVYCPYMVTTEAGYEYYWLVSADVVEAYVTAEEAEHQEGYANGWYLSEANAIKFNMFEAMDAYKLTYLQGINELSDEEVAQLVADDNSDDSDSDFEIDEEFEAEWYRLMALE